MNERQRRFRPQQACLREPVGRARNCLDVEVGHRRDVSDRRAVAENRQCLGDGRCLGLESCQSRAHDSPPGIRCQITHELGCGRGDRATSSGHHFEQVGQKQGVALG